MNVSYKVSEVLRARKLNKTMYELYVRFEEKPEPGTFFMVWLPDMEAVPLSVAGWRKGSLKFVVEARGPTTRALFAATKVGLLGPLGRPAPKPLGKPTLVAGGVGIAPLLYMKEEWGGTLLFGARSKERVPRIEEIDEVATDDGSMGYKGTVIDLLTTKGVKRDVYACGPPAMVEAFKRVAEERGIRGYYSTERLVKCGVGICGACTIDGKLLCKDPWLRVG